jgi:hypothetical protein
VPLKNFLNFGITVPQIPYWSDRYIPHQIYPMFNVSQYGYTFKGNP